MTRRLPDLGRQNPLCTAPRHGDYAAYRHGCRCPHSREHQRIYQKRRREGRASGAYIDSTGTKRRLRALAVMGWRWQDIGDRLGVTWQAVQNHAIRGPRIHPDTARHIADLYRELCDRRGPSAISRRRALQKGWLPPVAWDDIDNPLAGPDESESRGADEWAVDEALAGRMDPSRLNSTDLAEACQQLSRAGLTHGQIRYRLQLSKTQVERLVAA